MSDLWTTGRLAALVGATCEGPTDRVLVGVASLEQAGPDELSFCRGGRWTKALGATRAGAVFIAAGAPPAATVVLRHPEPRYAYAKAAAAMLPVYWPAPGIHPTAVIDPTAVVDPSATVGAFAVIAAGASLGAGTWVMAQAYVGRDARIGERCRLMPHSVVMELVVMGDRVWLQPGAVIGADGFGHVPGPEGPLRVPQVGCAVLEDDVEVGANACVDRAALTETRVGAGTRLDNLVQVAHGVQIGRDCLLAAFAGVAGGAKLGNGVVMGGRTAVTDGVEVGDGAVFAGLASASRDVPAGRRLGGSPARRYMRWLREVACVQKLPDWMRLVERRLQQLEGG